VGPPTLVSTDNPDAPSGLSDGPEEPYISLTALLKRASVLVDGEPKGRLEDIIVKARKDHFAPVTGIVTKSAHKIAFTPAESIVSIRRDGLELKSAKWNFGPVELLEGEISLKNDILCQRVIDTSRSSLLKAYDVRLARVNGTWAAVALDVHRTRLLRFGSHANHLARDWRNFLPLSRHTELAVARSSPNWIGKLKPAQIADLIEAATTVEQQSLLAQVHTDPELEADVFEELEDGSQAQVFKSLKDEQVAEVLSRMRADDVADAIMELAQHRRQPILDLLPASERKKVMTLLGYNKATAGGLMGTEFLALPEGATVREALQRVRESTTHQPEALITVHMVNADGKLSGTLGLVQAVQADPAAVLSEVADLSVVTASPDDDILTVVNRMADFNLLTLPVVDMEGLLLGVVTVDDALEAAIPSNWAQR
jgi:hypothetical protein